MSTHPDARAVVEAAPKQLFIGGEWRDATGGATLDVEDPATGETLCEVADATADDARAALDAAVAAQAGWAATPPNERSEILARAFAAMQERTDELALLMTLEMGKSLTESKGEIAYAAEFFRWFSEEARAHRRPLQAAPATAPGRVLAMQPAGRAVPAHHAVELPAGDGHAQDRPGDRRRLHDGGQARPADAAVDAGAGQDPRGGRAAGRRAQRDHRLVVRRDDRAAHRRPAAAQAVASPARPRSGAS